MTENAPADEPGFLDGKPIHEHYDEVERLRRAREDVALEQLLVRMVDAVEIAADADGFGVAPGPYSDLRWVYFHRGDEESERRLLERFARQKHAPGVTPPKLMRRLAILNGQEDNWGGRQYSRDPRTEPWAPMFGKPTRPAVVSGHIETWWAEVHDDMIRAEIERTAWYWDVSNRVLDTLAEEQVDAWQAADPALENLSKTQLIRDYADHRVEVLGIEVPSPSPDAKPCAGCGEAFIEASVEPRWIARFGYKELRHCRVCLDVLQYGRLEPGGTKVVEPTRDEAIQFIKDAVDFFQVIPTARDWLVGPHLRGDEIIEGYKIMARRPSPEFVRKEFGSWFAALAAAGVVDGDGERTGRGIRSIASDGHLCLSLGERTICEALADAGVEHEREPGYPDSNMRADFRIGNLLVEYLGMTGDPVYDEKTIRKRAHAEQHGLDVLFLYPKDLADHDSLIQRLTAHLPVGTAARS